ncbi:MAG: VOC family protein [candidate division Zixibacteria bacterium]
MHINIVSNNWRRLADFYQAVFGCFPLPPERNLSGKWVDEATGVNNAQITGIHLRLPGFGEVGPTLEIFQYNNIAEADGKPINRSGFAHIAFEVKDVEETSRLVLSNGGTRIGNLSTRKIEGVGKITFAYLADPEGNILELQNWEKHV